MRKTFRMNLRNTSGPMDLDFDAVSVVVNNPTASPVFLRIGAPDTPTATNADLFVPAGQSLSYPVTGYTFAAAFGNVAAIQTTDIISSGLFQTCIITFLGVGEAIPTYGSASFLSLSISELIPITAYTSSSTPIVVDLGPWGGALISIFPDSGSGQASVSVDASATGVTGTFQRLNTWAIWPGVPVTLTVPHGLRYMRVAFAATAIAGEPAVSGNYDVRATLAEIPVLSYSQAALGISKAVTVLHLSTTTNYFVTVGLPSVSIRWQGLTGNPLGEMVWHTGPTEAGPWALVAFREQVMGGASASLYRSLGNLDKFLRVDIITTDVTAGGLTGTLTLTTTPDPDLTSYLQNILAALGDVGQAVPNVNQDIFHLLQHIETWTGQASLSVASIDTKTSTVITNLGTIISSLTTINTNITAVNTNLGTINTSIGTTNTALNSVNTNLGTIIGQNTTLNTSLGTINASIGATNTALGTVNTNLGTINTNITATNTALGLLTAPMTRSGAVATIVVATAGVGVWTAAGAFLVPGWYMTSVQGGLACGAVTATTLIQVGYGTPAAVVASLYETFITVGAVAGGVFMGSGPSHSLCSNRSAGIIIPAGNTTVWVFSNAPLGAQVSATITQTP